MMLSSDLLKILIAVLTLITGGVLAFAHRCSQDGKQQRLKASVDEQNYIRIMIRSESTIPALSKLWGFFTQAEKQIKQEGLEMDINSLFFDTSRNENFNQIINELENTFTESQDVKKVWEDIGNRYRKLGYFLYFFALYISVGGFSLLYLYTLSNPNIIIGNLDNLSLYYLLIGIVIFALIIFYRELLMRNVIKYDSFKTKYLIDVVRL